DPADADALEEELFAAAARGELPPDAIALDRIWAAGRLLFNGGTFEPSLTRADVPRREASGRALRWVELGGRPRVTASPSAEVVILRVPIDDANVRAVDLVSVLDGQEVATVRDLVVTPGSGEVLFCCEGDRVRAGAGVRVTMRVYARDDNTRRVLRDYDL